MTKEILMTNAETVGCDPGMRRSFFVIHSSFVIRHSPF